MSAGEDERLPDDPDAETEADDAEDEDEFAEDDEDVAAELDEFDADIDGDSDDAEDIDAVVELSAKEQNARSLEIRRAIEERMEDKQMHEDLDYLDMDFDD